MVHLIGKPAVMRLNAEDSLAFIYLLKVLSISVLEVITFFKGGGNLWLIIRNQSSGTVYLIKKSIHTNNAILAITSIAGGKCSCWDVKNTRHIEISNTYQTANKHRH